MRKILRVTVASAMLIAGPSVVFAANMDGRTPNGTDARIGDKGRSSEQEEQFKLDYGTTGSIYICETQMWDEYGNCVVDPGYDYEQMR